MLRRKTSPSRCTPRGKRSASSRATFELPARPVEKALELVLRDHQVVEPGRRVVAIADSDPDLAAHPAPGTIAVLVREVGRVVRPIDVAGLGDDAAAFTRQPVEAQ